MPVVIVRSLPPASPSGPADMLLRLTRDLAGALGSSPDDVWAYWQEVDAVAMGGRLPGFEGHCPTVTILARSGRSGDDIARGLKAAAAAVSGALGVPLEDVWVHWLDVPTGRIFAGGDVR